MLKGLIHFQQDEEQERQEEQVTQLYIMAYSQGLNGLMGGCRTTRTLSRLLQDAYFKPRIRRGFPNRKIPYH